MKLVGVLFVSIMIIAGGPVWSLDTLPSADGNRILSGSVDLTYSYDTTLTLSDTPVWITGYGGDQNSTWFVLLKNGAVNEITISDLGEARVVDRGRWLGNDAFLNLDYRANEPALLASGFYEANPLGFPLSLQAENIVAAIRDDGRLIVTKDGRETIHAPGYLLDSRVAYDTARLVLLTAPSERYPHGILGDRSEATGFRIVDVRNEPNVAAEFTLDEGVFESLGPILADMDEDGIAEIILTRSDSRFGARLELYSGTDLVAAGMPVGTAFRWIHAIAVAPTGPDGEIELIAVKTPHIGGILEYYSLIGDKLIIVHERGGVSTHRIGSRNLDMALTGDFNGDGKTEVLVPSQDFSRLLSIRRTASGSEIDYTQYLESTLSTNIAGFEVDGVGQLAIGLTNGDFVLLREF